VEVLASSRKALRETWGVGREGRQPEQREKPRPNVDLRLVSLWITAILSEDETTIQDFSFKYSFKPIRHANAAIFYDETSNCC
jgi:hypothetical protein